MRPYVHAQCLINTPIYILCFHRMYICSDFTSYEYHYTLVSAMRGMSPIVATLASGIYLYFLILYINMGISIER